MANTFENIKRTVDQEKTKKVQGEARLTSLNEEKGRIFTQIQTEVGKPIASVEEAEQIAASLKDDITSEIKRMVEILKEEGIEVD